jgi:lysyl-tRNA synthetase class 2
MHSHHHLSEQEIVRRDKLTALAQAGIEAYPAPLYPVSHYSSEIKQAFTEDKKDDFAKVCVAGRVMCVYIIGLSGFF